MKALGRRSWRSLGSWTASLLMAPVLVLSGCIGGAANEDEDRLSHLRVGAEIEIVEHFDDMEKHWRLEAMDQGLDRYGVEVPMAVFSSEFRFTTHEITSRDSGLFGNHPSEHSQWPFVYSRDGCLIPHPMELLVLLSGARMPTLEEPVMYQGRPFMMDLTGEFPSVRLVLENDDEFVAMNMTLPAGDLKGTMVVDVRVDPDTWCGDPLGRMELMITEGGGEEVRFGSDLVDSPHESEPTLWPPRSDLASARFPLQQAAKVLEDDPRYALYAREGRIWPTFMSFEDSEPSTTAGMTRTSSWNLQLVREDGKGFRASVVKRSLLEGVSVEYVRHAQEGNSIVTVPEGVEWVDLQVLDDIVDRYSDGQAAGLHKLEYSARGPNPTPFVTLQREDPSQGDEPMDFICRFDGSRGEIFSCSHSPANIVV